jgi:hypothetical protein
MSSSRCNWYKVWSGLPRMHRSFELLSFTTVNERDCDCSSEIRGPLEVLTLDRDGGAVNTLGSSSAAGGSIRSVRSKLKLAELHLI